MMRCKEAGSELKSGVVLIYFMLMLVEIDEGRVGGASWLMSDASAPLMLS
jgi:hypothetical protein